MTFLRARATFWAGDRLVRQGEIVPASDPVVTPSRAQFFVPAFVDGVEQATAAPGERRNVRTVGPKVRKG